MTQSPTPVSFGALLRSWRHERGLSQSALALQAQTPARHVSFLETGRANPSRDMITRLSTALDVPLREQDLMFRAAGFLDQRSSRSLDDTDMHLLRQAVLHMMTAYDPYPALVINRDWQIVDANTSARRTLALVQAAHPLDDPARPANVIDLLLSPDGLRPLIENWDTCARQLIQRLHREALSPADLRRAMARVRRHPDLPDDWWSLEVNYDVKPVSVVHLRLGTERLSFFTVIAALAAPADALAQELRVETLFPANDETEKFLRAEAGSN